MKSGGSKAAPPSGWKPLLTTRTVSALLAQTAKQLGSSTFYIKCFSDSAKQGKTKEARLCLPLSIAFLFYILLHSSLRFALTNSPVAWTPKILSCGFDVCVYTCVHNCWGLYINSFPPIIKPSHLSHKSSTQSPPGQSLPKVKGHRLPHHCIRPVVSWVVC